MPQPIDPRIRMWTQMASDARHLMRLGHTTTADTADALELLALIYTKAETDKTLARILGRIEGRATVTTLYR
ncbi:MAG: hypothetical protein AAF184_04300 [Pseudomonadota bacterium]